MKGRTVGLLGGLAGIIFSCSLVLIGVSPGNISIASMGVLSTFFILSAIGFSLRGWPIPQPRFDHFDLAHLVLGFTVVSALIGISVTCGENLSDKLNVTVGQGSLIALTAICLYIFVALSCLAALRKTNYQQPLVQPFREYRETAPRSRINTKLIDMK